MFATAAAHAQGTPQPVLPQPGLPQPGLPVPGLPQPDEATDGRDIRVQVVAETSTTIGAPMAGRLVEFTLKDGDRFNQGQVLVKFDCAERQGQLAHAKAVLVGKRRILANRQQLRQLGTGTGVDYEVAAAEAQEAAADATIAQTMVDECTVTAPFSGRVSGISAHNFQFVQAGAPLLDILSDRDLELEMIVPSRWLTWLKAGTGYDVAIDETGKTYHAGIVRLSGKVDAVSRSIKVYGRISGSTADLLPGMSGRALLKPPTSTAQAAPAPASSATASPAAQAKP
jgi:RND family efflux transporter MFP subunit